MHNWKWLIRMKEYYRDPIDLLRLQLPTPTTGTVYQRRWWLSPSQSHDTELWADKQQRLQISHAKIAFARRYLWIFRYLLPWVQFVGITGSVSSLSAQEKDDIDFMIVCTPRRVAMTRFADWLLFNLLGLRRNRATQQNHFTNRFCFNFYTDTEHLSIEPQTAGNALELAELLPVFDRQGGALYGQLINKNQWVKQYLPAWYTAQIPQLALQLGNIVRIPILSTFMDLLDELLGSVQQRQIKKTDKTYTLKKHITVLQFWPKERTTP